MDNVHPESVLHTDGAQDYKGALPVAAHEAVDHNKLYARDGETGRVHTNSAEGYSASLSAVWWAPITTSARPICRAIWLSSTSA